MSLPLRGDHLKAGVSFYLLTLGSKFVNFVTPDGEEHIGH